MEETEIENKKGEDTFTNAIGPFGRWHITQALMMLFPTKFSTIWQLLAIIFLAPRTTFWCAEMASSTDDSVNSTIVINNSTCYSECVEYEYYTEFENTIISEWDLICRRQWLANFTQTMMMFGVLLGSTLFGFLADRFGRRPAFLSSCMIQLAASVASSFSPYFWMFVTLRFIIGVSTAGVLITSYIIVIEATETSKREMMNSFSFIPTAMGETVMPLIAYYLRSWDKFSLGIAIPNLFFLVYFFTVPESPKWLISMGKLEEASKVMTSIAKCNRHPSDNMMEVTKKLAEKAKIPQKQRVRATYMDLVRLPSDRKNNFCSCVIWFTLGLGYYGSQQFMGQTSTNLYATIALAGALQIPGVILGSWFSRLIGRRLSVITFSLIFAVANGLLALGDDWFYVKLVMGSIGTCTSLAAFSMMYMYTSELFPTVTRNMALGASSTSSRLGSMVAPFVAGLSIYGYWAPAIIFCMVPLLGAAAACCLPETKGSDLV